MRSGKRLEKASYHKIGDPYAFFDEDIAHHNFDQSADCTSA